MNQLGVQLLADGRAQVIATTTCEPVDTFTTVADADTYMAALAPCPPPDEDEPELELVVDRDERPVMPADDADATNPGGVSPAEMDAGEFRGWLRARRERIRAAYGIGPKARDVLFVVDLDADGRPVRPTANAVTVADEYERRVPSAAALAFRADGE